MTYLYNKKPSLVTDPFYSGHQLSRFFVGRPFEAQVSGPAYIHMCGGRGFILCINVIGFTRGDKCCCTFVAFKAFYIYT